MTDIEASDIYRMTLQSKVNIVCLFRLQYQIELNFRFLVHHKMKDYLHLKGKQLEEQQFTTKRVYSAK